METRAGSFLPIFWLCNLGLAAFMGLSDAFVRISNLPRHTILYYLSKFPTTFTSCVGSHFAPTESS